MYTLNENKHFDVVTDAKKLKYDYVFISFRNIDIILKTRTLIDEIYY